jgi:undecaprenyl-diphosphatase
MAGLFVGETRETAARFSFLLSIPAIAASGLLELKQALHLLPHDSLITLLIGTIVSAIIGYASIWFLLHAHDRRLYRLSSYSRSCNPYHVV